MSKKTTGKKRAGSRRRSNANGSKTDHPGHAAPAVAGLEHDQENPCLNSAGLLVCGRSIGHKGQHAAFGSDGVACTQWD